MDPSSVVRHLLAAKYFTFAPFVMFLYDLMLTFGEEVERIWKRPMSFATILFFLNRYGTVLEFIIILVAFNDPDWKGEPCTRYVRFEGSGTAALVAIGQMIMILRVYAMYGRNRKILGFLLFLWTSQIIVSAVGISTGFVVPLPPGLEACILTGSSTLFALLWISPIVTDSFIFILTLYRTKQNIGRLFAASKSRHASLTDTTITLLLRDGIIYYFFIFIANLMNALIYILAETDIKAIGASFSQLLTCTLISRLVLNLRSLSSDNQDYTAGDKIPQFNKQLEIMWTRTLNDFTEYDSAFTSEARHTTVEEDTLQLEEMTHHGHSVKDNSSYEVV